MKTPGLVLVAIFVVTLLSACSADAMTDSSESESRQPSSSSTNTSSKPSTHLPSENNTKYEPASASGPAKNVPVPKIPDAAKKKTEDGAAAFGEYYFDLINFALETNDSALLKSYTLRECYVCATAVIDPTDKAKSSGKWQVGGRHHVKVFDSYMPDKKTAIVSARFEIDPATFYLDPNTPYSKKEKRPSQVASLGMEFSDGWQIYMIDIEDHES